MKHILQRILLIACIIFSFIPSIVSAFGGPITSYYGGRIHPIFGTWHYHSGYDIGLEEGTDLPSVVSGTVAYEDWMDGFGNTIVVKEDGTDNYFLYGHMSQYAWLGEGTHVKQGQIIGYVGSTGNSTGAHLHISLTRGSIYSSAGLEDPMPWMLAAGWNLDGDTSGNAVHGHGNGAFFSKPIKQYFEDALNVSLGMNFDYIYKLGTSIRTALENITKGCIKAMQSLVDVSLPLLGVLAVIDVTMFIWRGPAITGQLESSFWTGMMQRLVKYGFLAFLISMWPTVINKVFIGTDQTLLTQFSSTTAGAMSDITAPDLQLQHFLSFLNPSITWLGGLSVKGMFDHMGLFLLNMFITYTSMILFIILIFWLIVTYIEFYVSAIFSVFSLSFAGLKPTTFISEGMVSHLINSTIKLLCVGVVYAIMRHNMELFAYSATDALDILKAFTMVITAVVVGLLIPQRIAEGLSVQAKL